MDSLYSRLYSLLSLCMYVCTRDYVATASLRSPGRVFRLFYLIEGDDRMRASVVAHSTA
jgi:hypothetical protein